MFREARMGNAIAAADCAPLVEEISNSVALQPRRADQPGATETADDYTYMHSVAVCALMIALARQLELDESRPAPPGWPGCCMISARQWCRASC